MLKMLKKGRMTKEIMREWPPHRDARMNGAPRVLQKKTTPCFLKSPPHLLFFLSVTCVAKNNFFLARRALPKAILVNARHAKPFRQRTSRQNKIRQHTSRQEKKKISASKVTPKNKKMED
jgi:hypothetical protein